jgi:hypothetical protein
MTSTQRTAINEQTFTEPTAEIAGMKLRPFSLGSLSICRRAKLTMLTGDVQPEDLTDDEKQQQIVAFIYIQSQPIPEVLKAVKDPDFIENHVLPFSMVLPLDAVPLAVKEIQRIMDAASAAYVEVQPKPDEKPEDEPPN